MNTRRAAFLLAASALAFGLPGCNSRQTTTDSAFTSEPDASSDGGILSVHKMGGDIDVKDAPHGADLSTMGGNIHVGHAGASLKVKTMGGSVTIDRAAGPVDATTMGGEIAIGPASGPIKATTMGGEIEAQVVGTSASRRDVELTSNGGTITLTVPRDFAMDVRVTLAYTKNATRAYKIVQQFGLEQRVSPDWDTSSGTPRKYILASGHVGSGLNHVTIKTINGDVILRQE